MISTLLRLADGCLSIVQPVVAGDENPLCTAAISELPGYSRVLYMCPVSARYITLQSPSTPALDVCTLSVYVQSAYQNPSSCPFTAGNICAPGIRLAWRPCSPGREALCPAAAIACCGAASVTG